MPVALNFVRLYYPGQKTATTIMHKIKTLFLSCNISMIRRLAQWHDWPRLRASLHTEAQSSLNFRNRNKSQTRNKGRWRWGGGGGSEIFYLRIKELFFFPCPCLTPIVSDISTISTRKKCKKWRKTCGKSALSRRASPAMPHHLAWVRYSVLINAILLRWPLSRVDVSIEGGGGGVPDFTTIEGRSQTSVFFRSPLDQKEAIGVVFRSMHPLKRF